VISSEDAGLCWPAGDECLHATEGINPNWSVGHNSPTPRLPTRGVDYFLDFLAAFFFAGAFFFAAAFFAFLAMVKILSDKPRSLHLRLTITLNIRQ